jgi:hypothetical protein
LERASRAVGGEAGSVGRSRTSGAGAEEQDHCREAADANQDGLESVRLTNIRLQVAVGALRISVSLSAEGDSGTIRLMR